MFIFIVLSHLSYGCYLKLKSSLLKFYGCHHYLVVIVTKYPYFKIQWIFSIYVDIFFSLVLRVIFPELLTSSQLYYSDVMILFDLIIIFELFLKL
jgi:hypothetical protein